MQVTVNNLFLTEWTILDLTDTPKTGMVAPGDIAFYLYRQSGTAMVAAAETVSCTELGVTGHYYISFTPANTGVYVLQLHEINALTQQRWFRFADIEVLTAGAIYSPSFTNAYCAETDIERYSGLSFTATSPITSNQVAGFAEERASVLTSKMLALGYSLTPATVVAGSRLEDLLRAANAIGAALDAVIAWYGQTEPAKTDKAVSLLEQWLAYVGGQMASGTKINGFLEGELLSQSSLTSSHILSGDTTVRTSDNAPIDVGFQIRMGDTY